MAVQIKKILDVENTTGLSRSSIYRMGKIGKFPKPIKLGERSSGWIGSEIDQWIDERIADSRNGES